MSASAFSATRWVLLGTIGFRVLSLGGQMMILRLVDKEIFGAYQSVVRVHLMALPLLPFAFDTLLIREKHFARRYAVALASVLAVTGCLFALGALLAGLLPVAGEGSLLAGWLGLGPHHHAMLLMAPIFLMMGMKLSARSLLAARLDFKTISIAEFGNGMITWLGGALALWYHREAWVLMAAYLAGETFEFLFMQRREKFRPLAVLSPARWPLARRLFRRHRSYCIYNSLDLTLNNAGSLLPAILLGTWIGLEANADFVVASQIIILPIMVLVGAVWRVAFPSISGVPEEELHRRCLRIIGTTAAFVAPGVIWLAFFAPTTAAILGGEKYLSAAPLVRWMAVYLVMTAIVSPISSLDMVRDRPEVGMWWNVAHTFGRVAVIWFAAPHGVVFTIAAMSLFSAALWLVWVHLLGWLLRAGYGAYYGTMLKFAPLWALAALGFWGAGEITGWHRWFGPALSAVPGLAYLVVVMKYFPNEASMARRLFKRN